MYTGRTAQPGGKATAGARARQIGLMLLLGLALTGLAGCGQKGPLVPPPAASANS